MIIKKIMSNLTTINILLYFFPFYFHNIVEGILSIMLYNLIFSHLIQKRYKLFMMTMYCFTIYNK